MLDLREVVSELTRSVGSALREVKGAKNAFATAYHVVQVHPEGHRQEIQRILSEHKNAVREDVHELQRKIGTLELDTTIMKSQRNVDRARTEQVEHGIMVLEATECTIRSNLQRLERDFEELSEQSHDCNATCTGPARSPSPPPPC